LSGRTCFTAKTAWNSGLGSGTGGIGWAFLEGYRANREHGNDEAAHQSLKYARGAAESARKAADFAIEHAVKTERGWKIPCFIRVQQ
jgi:hypothetical protein